MPQQPKNEFELKIMAQNYVTLFHSQLFPFLIITTSLFSQQEISLSLSLPLASMHTRMHTLTHTKAYHFNISQIYLLNINKSMPTPTDLSEATYLLYMWLSTRILL